MAQRQLCVNWRDESFRKMSTKISVWGTNGRLAADRQECQVYLRGARGSTFDSALEADRVVAMLLHDARRGQPAVFDNATFKSFRRRLVR